MKTPFVLKITTAFIGFTFLVIPAFSLPITREFVVITKSVLFQWVVFGLLFFLAIQLIATKKVAIQRNVAFQPILILVIGYILSVVLMSPNKFSALVEPHNGLFVVIALCMYLIILSAIVSRYIKQFNFGFIMLIIGSFYSVFTVLFFFISIFRLNLPSEFSFLASRGFNLLGTGIEHSAISFIVLVASGIFLISLLGKNKIAKKTQISLLILYSIVACGFILSLSTIVETIISKDAFVILPPWNVSWFAFVEIFKNPLTALFGIGVRNFSAIFTQVKPLSYNISRLWEISSFSYSRSGFLHIVTETGLIGGVGISLLFIRMFQSLKGSSRQLNIAFLLITAYFFLFPLSFISLFFLFTIFAFAIGERSVRDPEVYEVDLEGFIAVKLIISILILVVVGGMWYVSSQYVRAEVYFQEALRAYSNSQIEGLYQGQVSAIRINPRSEFLRRSFSQTNMLIATNMIQSRRETTEELTEQDQAIITQAIQTAINEAKSAVALNPQSSQNWTNLAEIYTRIVNIAQDASGWAISSYQQAITLDPRNPSIRFDLGSLYYSIGEYETAQRLFEQAVSLKSDWPNARYNLAWSYYQNESFDQAYIQMKIASELVDPIENETDYETIQKDLETFQKKLEEISSRSELNVDTSDQAVGNEEAESGSESSLTLPSTNLERELEINLPEEASPEANK